MNSVCHNNGFYDLCHIKFIFTVGFLLYKSYPMWAHKRGLIAHIDDVSVHEVPTPVGAGLVFSGIYYALCSSMSQSYQLFGMMPGLLMILIVGFLDDRFNLSPWVRLVAQFIAAFLTLLCIGVPESISVTPWELKLGPFKWVFFALVYTWTVNAYNFMDGSDGYACAQSMLIFSFGSLLCYAVGAEELSLLALYLVILLAMFFYWNKPVASVFMGDVGSTFLGALCVTYAIYLEQNYQLSWIYWCVLLVPFLADATLSLLRKLWAGARWSDRHQQQAFQRLIAFGMSRWQLLGWQLLLNIV